MPTYVFMPHVYSRYQPGKRYIIVWDEITNPLLTRKSATGEVCERMINSIPQFAVHAIIYPCRD